MAFNLKFVVDGNGKKTAVQIPINEWRIIYKEYKALSDFKSMKIDLTEATNEISLFEKGKRRPRTLQQFLNKL